MTHLLEVSSATFRYGEERPAAVDAVTTSLAEGQLIALLGPNGAGKSTLMKMLARVLDPTAGEITFQRRNLREWNSREYARSVGYLPQQTEMTFPMRAIDVVVSGRAPFLGRFEWGSSSDYERARQALAQCDAWHLADRDVAAMSGGERKRVFLARVLVADPRIILLDEPLSALDVSHTQQFTALLRDIVDHRGATVAFISHDMNWSAAYSDRMLVMSAGRLVLDASPREVMRPEVMKEFFGFDARAVASDGYEGSWIVPRVDRHKA
jgi:ABC-type cobalamin/Fe3+-siderophores transport systems, ATPase components